MGTVAGGRRDVRPAMERLFRLLRRLLDAGPAGASVDVLLAAGAYGSGAVDDRKRQLSRDLHHLDELGFDVRNVEPEGRPGRYVLTAGDTRLRVALSPEQRLALLRAARAAGRDDLAARLATSAAVPPAEEVTVGPVASAPALDLVLRAVRQRCLLHFAYAGRPRVVHGSAVRSGPSGWYVDGREASGPGGAPDGPTKAFVVARMSGVRIDAPGTAEPAVATPRRALDPLAWDVDRPVEVVVATVGEHRALVERLLGHPLAAHEPTDRARGEVELVVRVTHRAAFRARLYELGRRMRVVGPAEVRDELLAELAAVADAS